MITINIFILLKPFLISFLKIILLRVLHPHKSMHNETKLAKKTCLEKNLYLAKKITDPMIIVT